ncbi:hypothetical protein ACTHGU_07980 [Chitinophagaceae bacterium MMS25-I14]
MSQIIRYNEPLHIDELTFLRTKEAKERAQFYKVVRILLILCFVIPFAIAWVHAYDGKDPDPFSYKSYFIGVGALTSLLAIGVYVSYHNTLGKLHSDITHGTKTIEQTHITRKQYMPQTNTFYFYLDSPNKLSIEVSHSDYDGMNEGDELNIEYTTYSQLYLGYF